MVAAAVNTTVQLLDIPQRQVKVSVSAHDSAVYDVAFAPGSRDTVVSAGSDGSVRMIDFRALDESLVVHQL
ncbi:hypothetical protein KIPB_015214, partial [Kipferlia bialata]|eukprot:g15214.t1